MSIISFEKPNLLNTLVKQNHDTLLYVLAMSSFTTSFWKFFLIFMSLNISWLLPFAKPNWYLDMRIGSNFVILWWSSLEITLLAKVLRLTGFKSEKFMVFSFVGSNTTFVWVINLGNWCPKKKARIIHVISSPTIFQQIWKNYPEKPSEPLMLSPFNAKTTFLTSSLLGNIVISSFCSEVIIIRIKLSMLSSSLVIVFLNWS